MTRIRTSRRPVRPTFETLETRDMPSADLAAALPVTPPWPADQVLAAPARGSDTLDPGAQTLSAGPRARLHVVGLPPYDLDKAARLIAEKFNADFNQKNNIWGMDSVRLTYYGSYDYNGRQVVDVRLELHIREPYPSQRWTRIDFRMSFDAEWNLANPKNIIFRLKRTEVWGKGHKTTTFLPLETAVHTAWFFNPPDLPVRGAAGASWGNMALTMAARGNGPADTAPPARFANLHGQPETVLPQAAASAVPTGPLTGTPARADLDALFANLHGQAETVLSPAAAGAVPAGPVTGTPARAALDALFAS
jgi:hypothetical protein